MFDTWAKKINPSLWGVFRPSFAPVHRRRACTMPWFFRKSFWIRLRRTSMRRACHHWQRPEQPSGLRWERLQRRGYSCRPCGRVPFLRRWSPGRCKYRTSWTFCLPPLLSFLQCYYDMRGACCQGFFWNFLKIFLPRMSRG